MRMRIFLTSWAMLVLALSGCSGGGADGDRAVVAAFYPLAFAAEQIAGGAWDVRDLTPPGAEPHDLELSARDVDAVRSAPMVLYVGADFQPALEDALEGAEGRTIDLLDGLPLIRSDGGEHADPHVWLDPVLYARIARRIGSALGRRGAGNRFGRRLGMLDAAFARGLAHCERRQLVTSHAAFSYLARRYGLRQIAVTGLAPEAEPPAREVERVVDEVRSTGATTVFVEPLVSPRLAETVAREAGARTAELDPLEGLSSDALNDGATYFTVMRANLRALRAGLGCR